MADESETERAVREAGAAMWMKADHADRFAEAVAAYNAAVRADERATLARAVPPMTMTAVYEQEVRGELKQEPPVPHVEALLAEIDALRDALAARDAEIATLRAARDDLTSEVCRQAEDIGNAGKALIQEREAHARLVEIAKAEVADRDTSSVDATVGPIVLCGWCSAAMPEEKCAPECRGAAFRAALRGAP